MSERISRARTVTENNVYTTLFEKGKAHEDPLLSSAIRRGDH